MVRRSWGKSEHSDWFFHSLDFAIHGSFPSCSTLLLTPLNIHIHYTCIEMSSEIIIRTLGWAKTWNWSTLSASSPRRYWKETTMLTNTQQVYTASMMLSINLNHRTLFTNLVTLGVFMLSPQRCQIKSKIDIYFKGILGALVQNFAVTIHLLKI